ncbi:MAG: hypothetical protein ACI9CQ_001294 [Saprospiraceae bacterium]|jgi:hypothetical protein
MKKRVTLLFLLFLGLFYVPEVHAITVTSVNDGNWSDASTWSSGVVPTINDEVIIDGHVVTINSSTLIDADFGAIDIAKLSIINSGTTINGQASLQVTTTVTINITTDLLLRAPIAGQSVELLLSGSSALIQVNGNIEYYSVASGLTSIKVNGGATLALKGNILRPDSYGSLTMEAGTNFHLNGTGAQSIPADNNIEGEPFDIGNIILENDNGIALTAPLVVAGVLELTAGNIISSPANPVIIEDNAIIIGGSELAYIEGPVIKNGRSNSEFEFPIGDATTYAPMKISKLDKSASSFTAEYRGDPPPFGVFENSAQEQVLDVDATQHWELNKTAGSDDVTIQLAWSDGAASGLTSLAKTIVVGLSDEGTASATWMSYGQSATTGAVGAGDSGTVTSREGDPPPFGVFKFAVGRGETKITELPVELIKFEVKKDNGKASIEWKTASEQNSVQYEIERSTDGMNFEHIGTVKIHGDSETLKEYDFMDISPNSGSNYYRLKIVDYDGSYEYSDVATMSFGADIVIMVAPNPVVDVMTINAGEVGQNVTATVEVFDQSGKQLYQQQVEFQNGQYQTNASELNVTTPGAYFIRVTGSNSSKVVKFMKGN